MILNTFAGLDIGTEVHLYATGGHMFCGKIVSIDVSNFQVITLVDGCGYEAVIDITHVVAVRRYVG